MEIRLFGPMEVVQGNGSLVQIKAAKVRQVLAFLCSDPGRARSVESIADCLWGDEPPVSSVNLVQGYVSDLRRILGAEHITSSAAGYLWVIDAEAVDLSRFERMHAAARRLFESDPGTASALLEECASLVRGPAFADIAIHGSLVAIKARIEEAVIDVQQDRVELGLASGRHQGLVARLEELTAIHPLRETFWAQLAIALYRCGRQAEALRRCQQIRSLLREEIGVSPGPRLVDVEQRIARQDPLLDFAPVDAVEHRDSTHITTTLVGRGTELARLNDRLNRAANGQQLVFIGGEPGIGKSSLAIEVGRLAALHGAVVLHGRCDEHMNAPYLPFIGALSDYLRQLGDSEFDRITHQQTTRIQEVLPSLVARSGPSGPARRDEENPSMLERFETFSWLLDRVRLGSQLILILDDLQWADSTTLGLLSYLASGGRLAQTLILATYRSTELAPDSRLADLLAQLRSSPNAERMTLAGLCVNDIQQLIVSTNTPNLEAFAEWIHEETGGNPLFVLELARHIDETGQRSGVPDGIAEVLSKRIRRLSTPAQVLLARAAVLGNEFSVALLRAMNNDLTNLGLVVGEVERAGILIEHRCGGETGYRFAHASIRHAVANLTSIVTREELHLVAADALALLDRSGTASMAIAAHFAAAGSAAPTESAVAAFTKAGTYADQKWAKAEAVQWFDMALGLLAPDDDRRRSLRLTRFVSAQAAWHWHHDQRSIQARPTN